jgi:hypothetical protein
MATTVTLKPNAIDLSGSTSGTTTLQATAVAGTTTITLPAATDTLVGKATTDTLTNKTLTTPVINGFTGDTSVVNIGSGQFYKDASGNVGFGTTSPVSYGKFSIVGTTSTSARVVTTTGAALSRFTNTSGDLYVGVESSTSSELSAPANSSNFYGATAHPMLFWTNSVERMRINAGAPILCLAGGSTTATGTGIAFPATQSASSDANTLDDYEEGNVTLGATTTIIASSGTITINTSTSFLKYTKIGRQVIITGNLEVSSVSSPTGNIYIVGLPFSSGTNCISSLSLYSYGYVATMTTNVLGYMSSASTEFGLQKTNGVGSVAALGPDIQAGTSIWVSLSYFTS